MFAAVVVIFVIVVLLAFMDLRKTRKHFPIWFLLCTISFTVLVASGNLLHENPSHKTLSLHGLHSLLFRDRACSVRCFLGIFIVSSWFGSDKWFKLYKHLVLILFTVFFFLFPPELTKFAVAAATTLSSKRQEEEGGEGKREWEWCKF